MHFTKLIAFTLLCCVLLPLAGCTLAPSTGQPQVPETEPAESVLSHEPVSEEQTPVEGASPLRKKERAMLELILGTYSSKSFAEGMIDEEDLSAILEAGLRSPSARNGQPWHFSVVSDSTLVQQYIQGAQNGNILVIVSGTREEQEGVNTDFDCGLATGYLYIATQALGYDAHIYSGPVSSMNKNKPILGIPEGYEAVAAMIISLPGQGPDGVSSPSTRNPSEQSITYAG